MATDTLRDWLLDSNSCYLLGAGCSCCAQKPLMAQLTDIVGKQLSPEAQDVLSNLRGTYGRAPTVEDLMNYLLQLRALLQAQVKQDHPVWSPQTLSEAIVNAQQAVVAAVGTAWEACPVHVAWLQRLAMVRTAKPCDIFSLNYDTVIEASLEEALIPYTDGFCGADNAYFSDTEFGEVHRWERRLFRIHKLHGSVNWTRDDRGHVRRKPLAELGNGALVERAMIYPAEQKYVQSQYGVYEVLLRAFRERLRDPSVKNNKLIACGYSFGDEHINVAIEDALSVEAGLMLLVFVGPGDDETAQMKRFEGLAARFPGRVNVWLGDQAFLGEALDDAQWESLRDRQLWKFENLIEVVTGGTM